jgi:hypothetical protein
MQSIVVSLFEIDFCEIDVEEGSSMPLKWLWGEKLQL